MARLWLWAFLAYDALDYLWQRLSARRAQRRQDDPKPETTGRSS